MDYFDSVFMSALYASPLNRHVSPIPKQNLHVNNPFVVTYVFKTALCSRKQNFVHARTS